MKRIAILTGASSGMGRELALQLAQWETFDELWVIARRADRLEALKEQVPFPVRPISLDLTDPQALKDQMAKTADTFKEAAKKVSNKEVKDVLDPYVESLDKLKDMDPAGAMSGDTEYSAAVSDASTKANALASLCGISNGLNK